MGSVSYVEVNVQCNSDKRWPWGKWNYTFVRFLHFIAHETSLTNKKAENKEWGGEWEKQKTNSKVVGSVSKCINN